jgi:hypothetical protein
MPATIYARVDEELKRATDQYAADRGMSLASAVSDLVSRGLVAASDEGSAFRLEQRVRELEAELSRVRDAATAMDGRLHQLLGACECGQPLSGYDLLVTGRCTNCGRGITGLLTNLTESSGNLDRGEFAPFLAGIGVTIALIVLAYAASQD